MTFYSVKYKNENFFDDKERSVLYDLDMLALYNYTAHQERDLITSYV